MAKRFPLEIIIGATDRASAALRRVSDRIERFYQPFERLRQSFGRFAEKSGLSAVGTTLRNVGSAAWDVGRRVAVGFTAAAAAVGFFLKRNADAADEVGDTAARLNISTRALQAYRFGFEQADVAPEALNSALDTLNQNLGLAKIGMGKALPLFRGLALDPKKFKTIDQLLPALADRLSRIRDPAKRAAIANKLLGDAGAQMALKLGEGPRALAAMRAAAERAGVVLREDTIAAAGELDSRMKALRATFAGVAGNALGKLYPALIKIAEAIQAAIVRYQPQIEAFATQFAANLPRYLKNTVEAFNALRSVMEPIIRVFAWLSEKIGVANTILATLAAIVTGKLIGSLFSLGAALSQLGIRLTVAFGVPGLIVAAVVALVAAGWWLYKNWDTVSMKIGDAIDWLVDKFTRAWKWVKESAVTAFDWIAEKMKYHPLFLALKGLNWLAGKTFGLAASAAAPSASAAPIGGSLLQQAGPLKQQVAVQVDLLNLPPGARTRASASEGILFDLNRGFAMPGVQ